MDFDPRDYTDERDPQERDDDRERDEDDGLRIGRGSSSHAVDEHHHDDARERGDLRDRDDDRWAERDRDGRERDHDPRDVFTRGLDLPRDREREIVYDSRERAYSLRGSESRTLATVGAFRVVSVRDLRDRDDRPADPRNGDLRHLREQGLIETVRVPGYREQAVVLTDRGRDLLEANRNRDRDSGQAFYAGLKRERELEHDSQVYRAYERDAAKLEARGMEIERVRLEHELKREYQQWLHERDRGRPDADGRSDRDAREIERWAHEHDLPYRDGHVQFPDCQIEYRDIDGRDDHLNVEVTTPNYRGAHGAAVASSFSCHRAAAHELAGAAVAATAAAPRRADWPRSCGDDQRGTRSSHRRLRLHQPSGERIGVRAKLGVPRSFSPSRDVGAALDFFLASHTGIESSRASAAEFAVFYVHTKRYQAETEDPRVVGLVLASGAVCYNPSQYDKELVAQANRLVRDGAGDDLIRLPNRSFPSYVSAATYVDIGEYSDRISGLLRERRSRIPPQ